MRGRAPWRSILAAVLAASGALVSASTAVGKATAAGNARAASVLLKRAEIGSGWSQAAAPKSVPPITCQSFDPSLRGDVQIGAAISPRFQGSSSGPFVSQTAYVYATAAQGRAAARALMRAKLGTCVSASLLDGSGDGVSFAVSKVSPLPLPALGVGAIGFRVAGTASQTYQLVDVYLDAIVLARGATVTEVSFATFLAPASESLEVRLARQLARLLKVG